MSPMRFIHAGCTASRFTGADDGRAGFFTGVDASLERRTVAEAGRSARLGRNAGVVDACTLGRIGGSAPEDAMAVCGVQVN